MSNTAFPKVLRCFPGRALYLNVATEVLLKLILSPKFQKKSAQILR